MKTLTSQKNFFQLNKPLQLCERKLSGFWQSLCLSLSSLFHAIRDYVKSVSQGGPVASRELVTNTRHLVGSGFIVVGCFSFVFYHFFDSAAITDKTWLFISWYHFFFNIRWAMLMAFAAVGAFLFFPSKDKLAFIPFSVLLGLALAVIINYTFGLTIQVHNITTKEQWDQANDDFRKGTLGLDLFIIGLSLAVSFIICIDYLVYRLEHLRRGNLCRIIGLIKSPGLTWEEKGPHLEKSVKEFENYNSRI